MALRSRSVTGCVAIQRSIAAAMFCAVIVHAPVSRADILPSQVLVVYNSMTADGTALKDYYLAAHPGIPAANVFNLNNILLNTIEISYADFVSFVRDPIRNYLLQPGAPEPSDIVALCLIRQIPHRILDTDNGNVGDFPGLAANETNAGDMNGCALDAELALLWQNLNTGEAGNTMDSRSDNVIDNPYHLSSQPISAFPRTNIQTAKSFLNQFNFFWGLGGAGATRLTPGDLYLVCRIDGNTPADARKVIDRAKDLYVNKALVKVLLDEWDVSTGNDADDDGLLSATPADPFWGGDDFEATRDALVAAGWNVRYDGTTNFIDGTEETAPLVGYSSYGENHSEDGISENPPGDGTYINGYRLPPGAIFNTLESFNARGLNGLGTLFNQEQIADFIAAGGTFAVGNVYEPFTVFVPDSQYLMTNMLVNGLTFAEAAYTSFPALSWHQVALGDPLGKMTILNDPATPPGDMNGDGAVNGLDIRWIVDVVVNGPANYRAHFPALDPIGRGDFSGDFKVDLADLPAFIAAVLNG